MPRLDLAVLNVIDVESTCWEGKPPPGQEQEIIEIGICALDLELLAPIEAESILVRGVVHRQGRLGILEEEPGMLVLGPGSVGEGGVRVVPESVPTLTSEAMLSAEPRPVFDAFSFHYYGAVSLRCAAMVAMSLWPW